MSKSKHYLRLGIVLAAFAAVISLMCVAFSYADVNELTGTNNADGNQVEAVVGGEEQAQAEADATNTNDDTYTLEVVGFKDSEQGEHLLNLDMYYYDMNDNFIAKATTGDTDENPFAVFSDLTLEQTNGKLIFEAPDGYSDGADYIYTSYFDGERKASRKFVSPQSNLGFSGDENIDYFNYHTMYIDREGEHNQDFVLQSFKGSIALYAPYNPTCVAEVKENGLVEVTCTATVGEPGLTLGQFIFTPVYKDGYTFDYVQMGEKQYKVGDKVEFAATDSVFGIVHAKSDSPVEPTSTVLFGQVCDYNYDTKVETPISGATVKFANEETGEVYSTTTSAEGGTFVFNDISVDTVKKILAGDISEPCVYAIYAGYQFDIDYAYKDNWEIVGDKYVCESDLFLTEADINIYGADHHKTFGVIMDVPSGSVGTYSMIYDMETIGLVNGGFIPLTGLSFDINEGGIFKGEIASFVINENDKTTFTIIPQAEDGYVFDNLIVNGETFTVGDTVTFDGESAYDVQVNYKPAENGSGTNSGIAQTGDAVPFAVLIALGIIAGLSVVSIRKFSK